ncbi:hypothetical protein [Bacillus toyonensis]|uniref:hypothetical protein n=1 Tax=Bacillus toyonensis TaxID=155322 RepID=UPI001C0254F0|nr:hypothetical protein [Bacillus toyonensis]QWG93265.1 hypothetical protein EXW33_00220 [Bacillus toyonensis]
MNWEEISKQPGLSEDFIMENRDNVDWIEIYVHQTFSESFIDKYFDLLDKKMILQNQKLSLSMIEKYQHLENFWGNLSCNKHVTEDILEKFIDKWEWKKVGYYIPLSEAFIHARKNKLYWDYIVGEQKLSLSFIQQYEKTGEINFDILSMNRYLTEDSIDYYFEELDWIGISGHNAFSFPMVKKYIQHINLKELNYNENCSFTEEEWEEIKRLKGE